MIYEKEKKDQNIENIKLELRNIRDLFDLLHVSINLYKCFLRETRVF